MSTPAPPATTEAIATAIAHAERRLWLLEMMTRLCTGLLAMLKPGVDAALVFMKTHGAISRALRLCHKLEAETERLLDDLNDGILPAPKSGRGDAAEEREDREEREDLYDRESRDTQETRSDKAFRARLEELEALLDGGSSGRPARETAHALCRVLGLNPRLDRLARRRLAGRQPHPDAPRREEYRRSREGGQSPCASAVTPTTSAAPRRPSPTPIEATQPPPGATRPP